MGKARSISREIGTALAVLAIYLLTILAPLHHARASQLELEKLGYASIEVSWAVCTPAGVVADGADQIAAKCPATGVGKSDFILPAQQMLPVGHVSALSAPMFATAPAISPRIATPPSGSRAPPVSI